MPTTAINIRQKIIAKSNSGVSQRKIAADLKISRTCVYNTIKKWKNMGVLTDKHRSGRKRILTTRDDRLIKLCSERNPWLTARMVREECNLQNTVSINSVKRSLRRSNLFGRVAAKKPRLTKAQINKRFEWCNDKKAWTEAKWKSVVFSDECAIELNANRKMFVRRRPGDRLKQKYVQRTVKHSVKLMVWGAIRGDGHRTLVRCSNNVDSIEYQRILSIGLPQICNGRTIFQHDGAPAHRSQSTQQYLVQKAVRLMPCWPAQSPDLSPIENLWEILKRRLDGIKVESLNHLWDLVQREWYAIENEKISKLYASMPSRVHATIKSRGQHSKY